MRVLDTINTRQDAHAYVTKPRCFMDANEYISGIRVRYAYLTEGSEQIMNFKGIEGYRTLSAASKNVHVLVVDDRKRKYDITLIHAEDD